MPSTSSVLQVFLVSSVLQRRCVCLNFPCSQYLKALAASLSTGSYIAPRTGGAVLDQSTHFAVGFITKITPAINPLSSELLTNIAIQDFCRPVLSDKAELSLLEKQCKAAKRCRRLQGSEETLHVPHHELALVPGDRCWYTIRIPLCTCHGCSGN